MSAETRTCAKCGEAKALSEFDYAPHLPLGVTGRCRACAVIAVREWRRGHAEHSRRYNRDYRRRRRAALYQSEAAQEQRNRALREGAVIRELVAPIIVLERDDGVCGICGEDVDPFDYHLDHILSMSRGGEHSYANVQLAHASCHGRKTMRERKAVAA